MIALDATEVQVFYTTFFMAIKSARSLRFLPKSALLAGFIVLLFHIPTPSALAESDAPPPSGDVQTYLTPPSIIDKLLCAESILGPSLKLYGEDDWAATYDALYNKYQIQTDTNVLSPKGEPCLAMALGVKATDGVLALKARDTEALNTCSEQIEKLARKLNVPSDHLQQCALIKHHALDKQWIEAFMELGYLQQSVTEYLEDNPDKKDEGLLIILGGWLQGGRCITSLILDHYSDHASNVLREPMLVKKMYEMAEDMRPEYKKDPTVQQIMIFLPQVQKKLAVSLHAPIPQADVQWMHDQFDILVKQINAPAGAAPATN